MRTLFVVQALIGERYMLAGIFDTQSEANEQAQRIGDALGATHRGAIDIFQLFKSPNDFNAVVYVQPIDVNSLELVEAHLRWIEAGKQNDQFLRSLE